MLCVMVILSTDSVGSIFLCVYKYVFFFHAEADDVEERARSFMINQGWEGHLSYLNVEMMILLSGHGTRNPKQKMQAECCRVKAIRFSFTGGY